MKEYVIVANGEFLSRDLIVKAITNKIVIALDAAADKLLELNIQPDIILGDLDSISNKNDWGIKSFFDDLPQNVEPYLGKQGVTIVPMKDQEFTDLVKAIRYCDQLDAASIVVICATGGRLDHHEGMMRALRSEYKKNRPIILHTEHQTIQFAKDEELSFVGNIGDKCGIVAFPSGSFSAEGLEYPTKDLHFGFVESISNVFSKPTVKLKIVGEVLCIMPLQLNSLTSR